MPRGYLVLVVGRGNLDWRDLEREQNVMRIGVIGLGVTNANNAMACATVAPGSALYVQYGCGPDAGVAPGPCPAGYQLDDTGQICLPMGAIENVGGGSTPPCLPAGSSGPLQQGQVYCPAPVPKNELPSQGFCDPGMGLYQNSVCIPLTSPLWNQIPVAVPPTQFIAGVPNWALYAVAGLLAFVALKGGR